MISGSERAPDAGMILVVHGDRKTQRTVQRILSATLCEVEAVDRVEQARKLVAKRAPALLVLDHRLVSDSTGRALMDEAAGAGTLASLVLMGETAGAELPDLLDLGSITNLLANPMPLMAEELAITALKLLRRDIFGLEKYMTWGIDARSFELTSTDQRAEVIEELARSVREFGLGPRVASLAKLAADELLSNAIYNAPVDARGARTRDQQARHETRPIANGERVTLRFACDARYLAVEITDCFGSLDRDTILRHLAKAAKRNQGDQVDFSGPGAGMGLALAYSCANHLVFNLEPEQRTQVIGLFDVRFKPAELGNGVSSFNVFVRGRGETYQSPQAHPIGGPLVGES